MRYIVFLFVLLFAVSAQSKTIGFSLNVSGGGEVSKSTFGRLVYKKVDPNWSLGGGLFVNLHEFGDLSLNLNVGDLAQSTSLVQTTLAYTHYFNASEDAKWMLSGGLVGGFRDVMGTTLYFAGPIVKFGLRVGDEHMDIGPFIYTSGVLGEGKYHQSRIMMFSFGAGLEVRFGLL